MAEEKQFSIALAVIYTQSRIMKTTVDIPDGELEDVIRFTGAKTEREAIVTAIADFNRRKRMAELVRFAGSCADLIAREELQAVRRRGRSAGFTDLSGGGDAGVPTNRRLSSEPTGP